MELTIAAIENDLTLAETMIGRPGYELHLARAKIRATLIAGGYGEPTPAQSQLEESLLGTIAAEAPAPAPAPVVIKPELIEDDDEVDIFADARKERGHR